MFVALEAMLLRLFRLDRRITRSVLVSGTGAPSGATKHRKGKYCSPSKLIATTGRSICSFEWLLSREFVLAVVLPFSWTLAVSFMADTSLHNQLSPSAIVKECKRLRIG